MSTERWTIDDRFTFQVRVVCHHCGEVFRFNQPSRNKLDKFPATCPKCEGNWGIANKDYHYSKNYYQLRAEPLRKKIKEAIEETREEELAELEDEELEEELDELDLEDLDLDLAELYDEEEEEEEED